MDQKVITLVNRVKSSAGMLASRTEQAANRAVDVASRKATDVMETTKLNLQIFDLNSEIDQLYKELGKMLYDTHIGIEADAEEMQVKLVLLDEKRDEVETIREKLKNMKAVTQCPNCGKSCEKEDVFCSGCGAQL